ncbi:MAG: flagellar motor protein MotB [Candidatus Scalinduaceae bacterium]
MKRNWRYIGAVFLGLWVLGFVQGCAELEELRTANSRQAITIRDQMDELNRLRAESEAKRVEKERLHAELEILANTIGGGAAVRDTTEGPVIQLPETILFNSGFAVIKKEGKLALQKIAEHLKSKPSALIRIDGHTDADPIVRSKYLWDSNHHLSAGRALSVFQYLVKKEGIDEKRIHIAAYGPNRSIASNDTKEGKKQNRRVELLILSTNR